MSVGCPVNITGTRLVRLVRPVAHDGPQRLLSPVGTRADNGVMSNHDDRDGEEADVACEAVAQLTVLAGSGGTRSRHKSTLKAEIDMSVQR